jgi:ABC-type antimicrobial peptide transport system permease subunit
VRQFLAESILLALFGGLLGLGFAYEGCQMIWSVRPAEVASNLVSP